MNSIHKIKEVKNNKQANKKKFNNETIGMTQVKR